jgi:hypothetical protein
MDQNLITYISNMTATSSTALEQSPKLSLSTAKVTRTPIDSVRIGMIAYGAALLRVGVIVPVFASIIAVTLYLALPNSSLPPFLGVPSDSQWYTWVYSSFLTGVLWLVAALPFCYLSFAQSANPRNYTLLRSRLHQLKARLGMKDYADDEYEEINELTTVMKDAGFDIQNKHQWDVLKEAYASCIDVSRKLCKSPAGIRWVIGAGYNSAWTLLHHAEEAMIEVADIEEAVREAKHDFLAIQGSQIEGEDKLLEDVIQAVGVLKPGALVYFKEHQPSKSSMALTQLINKSSEQSSTSSIDGNGSGKNGVKPDALAKDQHPGFFQRLKWHHKNGVNPDALASVEPAARGMLREVRSTLNDFRDKRWEGLVRQRSGLLKAMAITGIVTHVLLVVTILTSSAPLVANQQLASAQSGILAAAAFYIVGAIAGLFLRFYSESRGVNSVDDFGLSSIRLVAIPLLSGLAGVGGVLFSEMLAALGGPALIGSPVEKHIVLSKLFSLDPQLLLTAAIFGVTPNLLIKGLQERANKYSAELQSSKAAETGGAGAKG